MTLNAILRINSNSEVITKAVHRRSLTVSTGGKLNRKRRQFDAMIGGIFLLALLALSHGMPRDAPDTQDIKVDEEVFQEDRRVVPDERCPVNETHYLLPHDYDCTKFYYCEYGLRWIAPRDCASGTEFSAELQVCIHPTLANCTLPGSPTPPDDSTTTTITCPPASTTTTSTTTPSTICPPTTTPSTTTTTTPSTTTTTPSTTTTTPSTTTTASTTTTTPSTTTTTPSTTTTASTTISPPATTTTTTPSTICPPATTTTSSPTTPTTTTTARPPCGGQGTLPNGCPADFTIHQLLPHENNCSKFYYCLRGELLERECKPGTHFNAQLQVCDLPINAGCDPNAGGGCDCGDGENGGGGGGGEGGDGGEGDSGDGESGGDLDETELLPNGCPADFSVHKLLPHKCDCTKFFYCIRGEKVEHSCPSGLHFSPTLQVCTFPADAGCENGGGDGGDGGGDGDVEDGGGGDGGGEGDGGDGNNKCETDCNVAPWPHNTDCDKFWRCDGKTAALVVCSEGLHFNAKTQTCDFICYANCKRKSIQATNHDSGLTLFIPWDRVDHNWVGQYIGHL